jgi:hypothetical protein
MRVTSNCCYSWLRRCLRRKSAMLGLCPGSLYPE